MAKIETCEISILMDENGAWRVGDREDLTDAAGGLADEGGIMVRQVNLIVRMSRPTATDISIDVPDDAGTTAEAEVSAEA